MGRLSDRLQEQDGRPVTYSQGSDCTLGGLVAVPMDAEHRVADGNGGYTLMRSVDWLFRVSSLSNVVPRPGDRIITVEGGKRQEYEVMPIDQNPCFEYHDNAGVMYVIHSNRVQ